MIRRKQGHLEKSTPDSEKISEELKSHIDPLEIAKDKIEDKVLKLEALSCVEGASFLHPTDPINKRAKTRTGSERVRGRKSVVSKALDAGHLPESGMARRWREGQEPPAPSVPLFYFVCEQRHRTSIPSYALQANLFRGRLRIRTVSQF
jgi:hypothetical protein